MGETVLAIISLDCYGELRGSYHGTCLLVRWPHVDKFTQVHLKEVFPTVRGAGNAHSHVLGMVFVVLSLLQVIQQSSGYTQ